MVGVAFFQVGKQQIDGALIFLVVLAGFAGVDKFQQGNKSSFPRRGLRTRCSPPTRNTKAVLPLPKNPPRFFLPHLWYSLSTYLPASKYLSRCGYTQRIVIGNPLKLSPGFPPLHTGHATFTASGVPSSIVSAVIHNHSFTLAKFATLPPVAAVLR